MCGYCNEEYRMFKRIAHHIPKCTGGPFPCELCSKNFDKKKKLLEHKSKSHKGEMVQHTRPKCQGFHFSNSYPFPSGLPLLRVSEEIQAEHIPAEAPLERARVGKEAIASVPNLWKEVPEKGLLDQPPVQISQPLQAFPVPGIRTPFPDEFDNSFDFAHLSGLRRPFHIGTDFGQPHGNPFRHKKVPVRGTNPIS